MITVINKSNETVTLPKGMSISTLPLSIRLPELEIPDRDGAVKAGISTAQQRRITASGLVQDENLPDILDTLLLGLNDAPLALYRRDTDDRFLLCELADSNISYEVGSADTIARVSLTFHAYNPFWQADSETDVIETLSDGQTMNVFNFGTAPVEPIVTITGQSGGTQRPKLTNQTNDDSLEYLATLSSGQALVLDCDRATAKVGSTSVVGNMDFAFAIGFSLRPGGNTIRLNTQSGNAQVRFTFRAPFL